MPAFLDSPSQPAGDRQRPSARSIAIGVAFFAAASIALALLVPSLLTHVDRSLPPGVRAFYQSTDEYLEELQERVGELPEVASVSVRRSIGGPDAQIDVVGQAGAPAVAVLEAVQGWIQDYRPGLKLEFDIAVTADDDDALGTWPFPDPDYVGLFDR